MWRARVYCAKWVERCARACILTPHTRPYVLSSVLTSTPGSVSCACAVRNEDSRRERGHASLELTKLFVLFRLLHFRLRHRVGPCLWSLPHTSSNPHCDFVQDGVDLRVERAGLSQGTRCVCPLLTSASASSSTSGSSITSNASSIISSISPALSISVAICLPISAS